MAATLQKAKESRVTVTQRVSEFVRDRYLSVDPRWLGIFRILFGVLLLVDGGRRFVAARAFYTNDGLLPNHYSLFRPMGRNVFSVFHAFSTMGEVAIAFTLTMFVFAMFTIGYRTKLFHVLSAICITSLNARNIFVENGGTVVVNILAIWTLFLPLGRRFSVDAVLASLRARHEQTSDELNDRASPPRDVTPYVSLVVLALMLQWSVIYFFNAAHKTGEGWRNGSTLHWFWHQDRIVTWFGLWARDHVPLAVSKYFTWATLGVEFTLAFILLVPFFQVWTRRLALLLAFGLHGGIALSSRLGPFSYVMTLFFVLLLGARDYALLERWFGRPARARTVIYDSDCGVCLLACRILKRLDPFERLTFVGNHERDRIPAALDAKTLDETFAVIRPDGKIATHERGIYEVLRALPLGIFVAFWFVVPGLSALLRILYRRFAEHRLQISSWLGLGICGVAPAADAAASDQSDAAPPERGDGEPQAEPAAETVVDSAPAEPAPEQSADEAQADSVKPDESSTPAAEAPAPAATPKREAPRNLREEARSLGVFLREALVVMMMLALGTQVLSENHFMRQRVKVKQPEWTSYVVDYPRVFQGWGMFAPEPPYDDGRIIVDGRTADGRKLDPLTGGEPEFDPFTTTGWGHDQFWCDYHNRIRFPGHAGNRQHLRQYLLNVHRYGGRPEDQLVAFDVWWVHDRSPQPGQTRGEPLPPEKLVSHGFVRDSGSTRWMRRGGP
jgi:predicted DCC family thiol-disulfide oxidoreductase YuxK